MAEEPTPSEAADQAPVEPPKKPVRKRTSRSVDSEFPEAKVRARTTPERPRERIEQKTETRTSPVETPKERDSRLKIEERKAAAEIVKGYIILAFILSVATVILIASTVVMLSSTQSAAHPDGYSLDEKKGAVGALVALVTAGLGYAAGKQQGK